MIFIFLYSLLRSDTAVHWIDLVVLDYAYHVIDLKTQCLWVTSVPIPGLHNRSLQLKNKS